MDTSSRTIQNNTILSQRQEKQDNSVLALFLNLILMNLWIT